MKYDIEARVINQYVKRSIRKNNDCSLIWKSDLDIKLNGAMYRKTKGVIIVPDKSRITIGLSDGQEVGINLNREETKLITIKKEGNCIVIETK